MYTDDNQENQNNSINPENPATGDFSDKSDIIEKNSISRIQQHNYEDHADMTYCAESTPNQAGSSNSSYATT